MRVTYGLIIVLLLLLQSCSKETSNRELSHPGFGVTETTIKAVDAGVDLPVLLKTDDIIKGIQFTLSWDASIGQVLQPALTAANPGFTISSGEGDRGEMKVLIFSMTGDEINTTDPKIMTIPVRIIDPDASRFALAFKDAIFAGPSAVAYEIPVTHAKLEIIR